MSRCSQQQMIEDISCFFFTNNSSSRGLKNNFYNSTYYITFYQETKHVRMRLSLIVQLVIYAYYLCMYSVYILYIELCIHKFVCICYVYIGKRNLNLTCSFNQINTVFENIIVTTKIRNNYCVIQSFIFPILRQQYWIFLYCSL